VAISTKTGPTTGATVVGPATMPGVAFGFSTRAVIDATAEAVRGLIGYEPTLLGENADMVGQFRQGRGAVMENTRVTDRYTVTFSGGSIGFGVKYARPWDNDGERFHDGRGFYRIDREIRPYGAHAEVDGVGGSVLRRGAIKVWSVRSRLRMMKALADVDHDSWKRADLRLGMVTLTLPGSWKHLAPRGRHFKGMVRKLRFAWERHDGVMRPMVDHLGPWQVVWKQEFQERGAPHMHVMMRVPDEDWRSPDGETFRQWLSRTWADCVSANRWACHACGRGSVGQTCDCPRPDTEYARNLSAGTNVDFGSRGTDPRRIAVYFLKHSSKTSDNKEYQHNVPPIWWDEGAGPGRFWGISGLERLEETIEVTKPIWDAAKRLGRHLAKAHAARVALSRRGHAVYGVSEATRRATLHDLRSFGMKRSRVLSDPFGGGWILSNDAPALVYRLAVFLAARPPGTVAV